MKSRILFIICSLWVSGLSIVTDSRTVLSAATREPVVYANVGIINRNIGTVTDTLGNFLLKIPSECVNDSVRISSVGYCSKTFAVKDIASIPDTILLDDDMIMLSEVVVKPGRIKHRIAGRKGGGGFVYIYVEGDKAAGQGLAMPLNVRKRAWLKKIGFNIITDNKPLSHMKFRVNIYQKSHDVYSKLNLKPVYFDYDISLLVDGYFSYSFPEEILLGEGEYYIELEFLENFYDEYFTMKSKLLTGKTRYRYASQSEWETLPFGAPLYIEYDNEE